jgi:hypothetical protein
MRRQKSIEKRPKPISRIGENEFDGGQRDQHRPVKMEGGDDCMPARPVTAEHGYRENSI